MRSLTTVDTAVESLKDNEDMQTCSYKLLGCPLKLKQACGEPREMQMYTEDILAVGGI